MNLVRVFARCENWNEADSVDLCVYTFALHPNVMYAVSLDDPLDAPKPDECSLDLEVADDEAYQRLKADAATNRVWIRASIAGNPGEWRKGRASGFKEGAQGEMRARFDHDVE